MDDYPIVDYADLFDFIDNSLADHPHFCDAHYYLQWEREVAQPALEATGFQVLCWTTAEHDAFGPLIRACHAVRGNHAFQLTYG